MIAREGTPAASTKVAHPCRRVMEPEPVEARPRSGSPRGSGRRSNAYSC
jgi:hypothetical protein